MDQFNILLIVLFPMGNNVNKVLVIKITGGIWRKSTEGLLHLKKMYKIKVRKDIWGELIIAVST